MLNARELTAGSPLVHRDNPSVGKALAQEEMALKWAGEPFDLEAITLLTYGNLGPSEVDGGIFHAGSSSTTAPRPVREL
jgi:hypothetical protein